jgi:SAM-dependent methyltransferase
MAWTEELLELVSACVHPGARLLEVGCGNGRLALALAQAGYLVTAIDPRAPDGELFRQVALGEFEAESPFHAVVARRSLHHIDDLSGALDRIHSLLEPGGLLVMGEFAWDRMDEPTARWYRRVAGPHGHRHADWREEHEDLHGYADMAEALEQRFRQRSFRWTPYLARELGRPELEPEEISLIEAGEIQAIGFEYVGERR